MLIVQGKQWMVLELLPFSLQGKHFLPITLYCFLVASFSICTKVKTVQSSVFLLSISLRERTIYLHWNQNSILFSTEQFEMWCGFMLVW